MSLLISGAGSRLFFDKGSVLRTGADRRDRGRGEEEEGEEGERGGEGGK